MRIFKHLTMTDRLKIESMLKQKMKPKEIAGVLRVHVSTIYRELKRGVYLRLNKDWTTENSYSPDIAHQRYRDNLKAKGRDLKIGNDHAFAAYIEHKIAVEKYSPAAVLGEIMRKGPQFQTSICRVTLYNYIDKGVFLTLTNKALPIKGKRKQKHRIVKQARAPRGESIEKRPKEIETREEFGHWEMDCIEGNKKSRHVLLMLTERKTRMEFIFRMKDQTAGSVVKVLDKLERRYRDKFPAMFKTITVDNGSEFADCRGMELSAMRRGRQRTKMYYCHPYSSWERGSNEKQNGMVRRLFPKGTNFRRVTETAIRRAEAWVNNYPRAIFDFGTSAEEFSKCVSELM